MAASTARDYTPLVAVLSAAIIGLVAVVFFVGGGETVPGVDVRFLPLVNAVLNTMTTLFLIAAFLAVHRKNIVWHRRFIYGAFSTTGLFLVTYLIYHALSESTRYGGSGLMAGIYYFVLLSHIVLAAVIVPLALVTFFRGISNQIERHRAIARWTMPLWLYVSMTGVLVYLMIAPYY
jgi:putative membrane protein